MNTRIFLVSLLGSTLVVGCTNPQLNDSLGDGQAVLFRSLVTRPDRGLGLEQLSNTDFGLWAYQGSKGAASWGGFAVSSNAQVLQGGVGGFADPNQTVYWPSGESLLGFYAYAPYSADARYGVTNLSPTAVGADQIQAPSFDFSVARQVADQVDLLVARTEGMAPTAIVPLSFRHALTKPVVVARVTAPNWRVAITQVAFEGIADQGRFTFPVLPLDPNAIDGWSVNYDSQVGYAVPLALNGMSDPAGPGVKNAVVLTTDSYVPVASTAVGESMFLLPQTLDAAAVMVVRYNIHSMSSNTELTGMQEVRISLSNKVWSAGSVVSYRLSFDPKPAGESGSPVDFSSSVAGWDDGSNETVKP